jgi:acyl carrier protein
VDDTTFDQKMLSLITEAVPAKFRKTAFTPEMRLQRDLGLDSIAMLALLFRFEQAFGIDLATVDVGGSLARMRTVADALAFGRQALEQANSAGGR